MRSPEASANVNRRLWWWIAAVLLCLVALVASGSLAPETLSSAVDRIADASIKIIGLVATIRAAVIDIMTRWRK